MFGRFLRRAAGSVSRRGGRRARLFLASLAGCLLVIGIAASIAASVGGSSKEVASYFGSYSVSGLGGTFNGPRGVGVNNSGAGGVPAGTIYVADLSNNRIDRFDSSGNFVSAWGFDVVESGPDNNGTGFEVCKAGTADVCKKGIESVSPAPGGEMSSPQGVAVDQATGDVYVDSSGFRRVDEFSATGSFIRAFGQDVVQSGMPESANAIQAVSVSATAGRFTLSFKGETTGELEAGASAATVQAALNGLAAINAGGGSVAVSGGPGDATASKPYVVTFNGGPLKGAKVAQMTAAGAPAPNELSGGSPSSGVTVATTNEGETGFEVCATATNCKTGTSGSAAGAFVNLGNALLAVAPPGAPNAGDVLVADKGGNRVSEFASTGVFVRSFGFDVVKAGPDNNGTGFEICKFEVDECKSGASGSAVGQFGGLKRVAEDSSGNIYTAEYGTNFRVQKFTPAGAGLTPSLFGTSEVQEVRVNATGGKFTLTFARGSTTPNTTSELEYNASAATVEAALNGLTSIKFLGAGAASVSGPNGGPYVVTFNGGALADADVPQMTGASGTTSPLTGGSGAGANKVTVTTTTQGAPGGITNESQAPSSIALDGSGNVLIVKGFEAAVTPYCLNTGLPSVENEQRVLEMSSAGALLGSDLTCAGITSANGLAVNTTSGRPYLTSEFPVGTAQVYVLGSVTPPNVTASPVTKMDAFSATLEGSVNPGGQAVECRFDYIKKSAYEQNLAEGREGFTNSGRAACASSPGSGSAPIAVSALATSLTPSTAYEMRLAAYTALGSGAVGSSVQEFTTPAEPPPTIVTGAVAPRGTTTARLSGLVNPNNSPTTVHFEYGTAGPCSSNPCESTPEEAVGSAYIKRGEAWTAVVANLTGLAPATTYHYRLVGKNSVGIEAGVDRTFTTLTPEPAPGSCPNETVRRAQHTNGYLPDCRGVELVNSPDKGNQNVRAEAEGLEMAVDGGGEAAFWRVLSGSPGGNTGSSDTFLARRLTQPTAAAPNGWESKTLIPPAAQQFSQGRREYALQVATPALSRFIFEATRLANPTTITVVRISPGQSPPEEVLGAEDYAEFESLRRIEITDDAAHVVGVLKVDELVDAGSGTPEPLALMPDGTASSCGVESEGPFTWGTVLGGVSGAEWHPGYNMIATTDASRVYFQAKPNKAGNPTQCESAGLFGIYERNREANAGTGQTTLIDPGTGQSPELIRVTPNGRSAYFVTYSKCRKWSQTSSPTCEAPEAKDTNNDADVYRWDEASDESTCLTCGVENEDGEPVADAAVLAGTPVMVSDDFSHVYFQSTKQLVVGHGRAGHDNLYALSGGKIRFVADPNATNALQRGNARLSADGNVLVFSSGAALTADQIAPGAEEQLYRYDDRDGGLECVSCLRGGQTSHSFGEVVPFSLGLEGGWGLSKDGSTVVFKTAEALLPGDVNNGTDIYEWHDGAVHLITDGVTEFQKLSSSSPFVDGVDATGANILFQVTSPGLTGFEQDSLANMYDARVNGGFMPPSPPEVCVEDSCQGPLPASPFQSLPGSALVAGANGNVSVAPAPKAKAKPKPKVKRCAKGRVRRRVKGRLRCVKQKGKRARRSARRGK